MIKIKTCNVGDIVKGVCNGAPFTDASIITLFCFTPTGIYKPGDHVLLGWNGSRQPNFSYPVAAYKKAYPNQPESVAAFTHVYWVRGDLDVDVISGTCTPTVVYPPPQAIGIHCCNSWSGCMEAACVCSCFDCMKVRAASTNNNVATAVKKSSVAGMNCAISSCNTYCEFVEPNQADGKSFVCYSCRTSGRKMRTA